jgi:hypothetical protein
MHFELAGKESLDSAKRSILFQRLQLHRSTLGSTGSERKRFPSRSGNENVELRRSGFWLVLVLVRMVLRNSY